MTDSTQWQAIGGGTWRAIPTDRRVRLQRVTRVARLMDRAVRVPGTRFTLGFDALIGLLPVVGDWATGAIGVWAIYQAWRMGAPRALLGRMATNLVIDAAIGSVPVVGDLFDIGWRAQARNADLLTDWVERSAEHGR
jgi:hypothetical protein